MSRALRIELVLALCACVACGKGEREATTVDKVAPPNEEAVRAFVAGAIELKTGSRKHLDRAVELLTQAIKKDPNLWEAHYDLGLALRRRGELDQARASFDKARALAADAPEPVLALAECEIARGELSHASDLLQDLLRSDPINVEARLALAAVFRMRGKLDEAIAQAREVLVRNANEVRALVEIGRAYRAQKDHDVAELVLEKARALDPKNAFVHNELGLLALERGDTQLAFTRFAEASELDEKLAAAHMNRASVLLRAGDFASAERAYKQAKEADAAELGAQIGLAIALRGQGKHKEAERAYETALEQDPESLEALLDLAILRADFLDRRGDALPLFEKFLELSPKSMKERELAERYVQDIRMAASQGAAP
jgi:tetratricopeptide (TPR) repeat protein